MAIEIKEFVGYNLEKEVTNNMACGGKKTAKKTAKKTTKTKKK